MDIVYLLLEDKIKSGQNHQRKKLKDDKIKKEDNHKSGHKIKQIGKYKNTIEEDPYYDIVV